MIYWIVVVFMFVVAVIKALNDSYSNSLFEGLMKFVVNWGVGIIVGCIITLAFNLVLSTTQPMKLTTLIETKEYDVILKNTDEDTYYLINDNQVVEEINYTRSKGTSRGEVTTNKVESYEVEFENKYLNYLFPNLTTGHIVHVKDDVEYIQDGDY